ncbi:MAG: dihydrofolate reductase [Bacteroidetes bacterium]|nr:dihydrofolate reductase [Bacteroidota bacterium]
MNNLIISMHVTLDGYVAGTGGEMDWVKLDGELFDYVGGITNNAATALYGRRTFEMMNSYWPEAGKEADASKHDKEHSEWYNRVDKLVLSNTMQGKDRNKVKFIDNNSLNEITAAKQKGNIVVFGSPSAIHTLFSQGMIDEMYLFVNPVLLGAGISLYEGINERMLWKLQETKRFDGCGVVSLHYTKQ